MKSKPRWPLFLTWLVLYTALDYLLSYVLHGAFLRSDLRDNFEGALFGATVTWLFALYRWHKADAGL